jgi:hypothetical protein
VLGDPTLVLLWDERILGEYAEVLARPKLGIEADRVRVLVDRVRSAGERVIALRYDGAMADEDDRVFLEVAIAGRADFLVTGNRRHFPPDEKVPFALRGSSGTDDPDDTARDALREDDEEDDDGQRLWIVHVGKT